MEKERGRGKIAGDEGKRGKKRERGGREGGRKGGRERSNGGNERERVRQ